MDECAICLCELTSDTTKFSCGHVIHKDCAINYLRRKKYLCPLCRRDVSIPNIKEYNYDQYQLIVDGGVLMLYYNDNIAQCVLPFQDLCQSANIILYPQTESMKILIQYKGEIYCWRYKVSNNRFAKLFKKEFIKLNTPIKFDIIKQDLVKVNLTLCGIINTFILFTAVKGNNEYACYLDGHNVCIADMPSNRMIGHATNLTNRTLTRGELIEKS